MAKISLILWSREIGNTKKFPLKIRINNKGKISYKPLGISIVKNMWDTDKKDVKKTCKQYREIKKAFEKEEAKYLNEDGVVDEKKVELLLSKKDTLQNLYEEYLKYKKEKYAYSTYSTNLYVYECLKKHVKNKTTSIYLIDRDWIEEFHDFLGDAEKAGKKYSINTIHAYFFSFVAFLKWLNKEKKFDIGLNFTKYICEKPEKNPQYNTHIDLYKEVIHSIDWAKQVRKVAYLHMCRYLLSVSLLGVRSADLLIMKLSNFKTKIAFSNVVVDEENEEYEQIVKKEVECTYYMLKNKRKMNWVISDSAYKYLIYFMDKDLQIDYANKFDNCIVGRLAGNIDDDVWHDEDSFNNLRILYEYEENGFFKRTFEFNEDLELEKTGSMENYDDSEKIEYAKKLFYKQIKRVENDSSKDRYLTGHMKKGVDYEALSDKEKFETRNGACAAHAMSIKNTCKKFNIPYFNPHQARHTVAQLLILSAKRAGKPVDIQVIRNTFGHKSTATADQYISSLTSAQLSDATSPALNEY